MFYSSFRVSRPFKVYQTAKCEYAPRWAETGRITDGLNVKLLLSLLSNNDLLIIFLLSSTKIKQHVNQTKNIFYNLKLLDAGRWAQPQLLLACCRLPRAGSARDQEGELGACGIGRGSHHGTAPIGTTLDWSTTVEHPWLHRGGSRLGLGALHDSTTPAPSSPSLNRQRRSCRLRDARRPDPLLRGLDPSSPKKNGAPP